MSDESLSLTDSTSLSPLIREMFEPLCEVLSPEDARALVPSIKEHARAIQAAQAENEFLDAETGEKISNALVALLMDYERYSDEQKRLVVGAARYFIDSQDAEGDLTSILGCEDDAEVLNYVVKQLNREDLRVTF